VCLLGGQAAYLNGDYWLARWASKSPEEQQKVRIGHFVAGHGRRAL
jgi:hypothetical protein